MRIREPRNFRKRRRERCIPDGRVEGSPEGKKRLAGRNWIAKVPHGWLNGDYELNFTEAEQEPLILEFAREFGARRKRPVNLRAARSVP